MNNNKILKKREFGVICTKFFGNKFTDDEIKQLKYFAEYGEEIFNDISYIIHNDLSNETSSKYITISNPFLKFISYEPIFSKKLITKLEDENLLEYYKICGVYHYEMYIGDLCKYATDGNMFLYGDEQMSKMEFDKKYGSNSFESYTFTRNGVVSDSQLKRFSINKSYEKNEDLNYGCRGSKEYNEWINKVLDRDKCCCAICGSSLNLQIHHIKNYSQHKDLRVDVNNGITLCELHHSSLVLGGFHNTYGTYNNTSKQLQEYIDNKRNELGLSRITLDEIINIK